jgi:hypothetical protein
MKWTELPLKVTVKRESKTWIRFLTENSVVVLTKILVTDTLLSSQLAKQLNSNSNSQLILVMVVLYTLMVNSLSVLLKISGKVENPNYLTLKLMLNLECTIWLFPVLKLVVMVLLNGNSELTVVLGKTLLLLT